MGPSLGLVAEHVRLLRDGEVTEERVRAALAVDRIGLGDDLNRLDVLGGLGCPDLLRIELLALGVEGVALVEKRGDLGGLLGAERASLGLGGRGDGLEALADLGQPPLDGVLENGHGCDSFGVGLGVVRTGSRSA